MVKKVFWMNALNEIIKEKIQESGRITFAEFMNLALYHPEYGYYSSEKIKLGKKGDYYTSPLVHKIFGELLCKQIAEMWNMSGAGDFTIVEMGAGDGTLCCDILNYAKETYPAFYKALQYIIIEESRGMRDLQKENLRAIAECGMRNAEFNSDKLLWLDYSDPLFKSGINGCFISNELVDAFPVHIVEKRGGELKEVFVDLHDNTFVEVFDSSSTPEIEKYFNRLGIELEDGQRAEVNLKAIEWMRWVAKRLKIGFVITIDYGYPAEELYAPHRMGGTLLCYHRHRIAEDPFINIGEQDITAHVDFTTLMMIGEEEGLKIAGITDQMHFLFGLGIGERIEAIGLNVNTETEALKERLMIKNLIMPGRMGNIFKILIQYKEFEGIPSLSGLKKDPFTF